MWIILQEALIWIVGLFIISQIILPILFPTFEFFWIFKQGKKSETKPGIFNEDGSLESDLNQVKGEYKTVIIKSDTIRKRVDSEYENVKKIKDISDTELPKSKS